MKLMHKSLSICIVLALWLIGMPGVPVDARAPAGATGIEKWTVSLPPGVTRADWEQIEALLPTDLPVQQAYLKASNTGAGDDFGVSVAVSGDTVVVGAPSEDSNATGVNGDQNNNSALDSGAVYVFIRNGTTWSQQAYLKASNTGIGDYFGHSVAISGNTIVVGALDEDSNATGVNGDQSNNSAAQSGAVYVFTSSGTINGTTWNQQAYLKASNTGSIDVFGDSVAISGDTIVVGATWEDSNAMGVNGNQSNNLASDSGAAYVFTRSGATWSQQAYLKASNTGAEDYFGHSVAISGDTVVIGGYYEDSIATGVNGDQSNNSAMNSGAAYVFTRSGTMWRQQAYLKSLNTGAEDYFGNSVAISGNTIVIGAYGEDSNATGVNGDQSNNLAYNAGAAYLFISSGTTWSQEAYLKASNTGVEDYFGNSVAISGDTIVVGAYSEDSYETGANGDQSKNWGGSPGAVYVFIPNETTWSQQAYLKASNTDLTDRFGYSIAISADTIVVGAFSEDSNATGVNGDENNNLANDAGAAYVFFAQPSDPKPIKVLIGGIERGAYALAPSESTRQGYEVDGGPVKVTHKNINTILASERFIFSYQNSKSYAEMMGYPGNQLATDYWFTWYNNISYSTQLRVSNMGSNSAEVKVYAGSSTTPIDTFTLSAGEGKRVSYQSLDNGPLHVVSTDGVTPILASERFIQTFMNSASYSEMMGYPGNQLATEYWFPWYNNISYSTQLRVSNLGSTSAEVKIYAGSSTTPIDTFILSAGEGKRVSYTGLDNGPLHIVSTDRVTPILASERFIQTFGTSASYAEMMGYSGNRLANEYCFPWYNNTTDGGVTLSSQLRVSNLGYTSVNVKVFLAGVEKDSFTLLPGQGARKSYAGFNNGPLCVTREPSLASILASERFISTYGNSSSYSEMMGYPMNKLASTYWFPWYNNLSYATEIRIAKP